MLDNGLSSSYEAFSDFQIHIFNFKLLAYVTQESCVEKKICDSLHCKTHSNDIVKKVALKGELDEMTL